MQTFSYGYGLLIFAAMLLATNDGMMMTYPPFVRSRYSLRRRHTTSKPSTTTDQLNTALPVTTKGHLMKFKDNGYLIPETTPFMVFKAARTNDDFIKNNQAPPTTNKNWLQQESTTPAYSSQATQEPTTTTNPYENVPPVNHAGAENQEESVSVSTDHISGSTTQRPIVHTSSPKSFHQKHMVATTPHHAGHSTSQSRFVGSTTPRPFSEELTIPPVSFDDVKIFNKFNRRILPTTTLRPFFYTTHANDFLRTTDRRNSHSVFTSRRYDDHKTMSTTAHPKPKHFHLPEYEYYDSNEIQNDRMG